MHLPTTLLHLLSITTATHALFLPDLNHATTRLSGLTTLFKRQAACPAIWTTLSHDLTNDFHGSDGMCTDLARAAIRFAFHDAGAFSQKAAFVAPAGGGADGSLLLNPQEVTRPESAGLQPYFNYLNAKYQNTYKSQGVGAADLVQFAAAHATRTCPFGPRVSILVGRKDSAATTATGLLPPGFGPGSDQNSLVALFADKGFNATELAALVGAHSVARVFNQSQIPVGNSLDSTPGTWDVKFYAEVRTPPTNVPTFSRLDSDINLSQVGTAAGSAFTSFQSQNVWNPAFAAAWAKLSVLGIPASVQAGFVDCTRALP